MNFSESDITLFGKRNVHNVPVFKIKEMFEIFEDDSSEEIVLNRAPHLEHIE